VLDYWQVAYFEELQPIMIKQN